MGNKKNNNLYYLLIKNFIFYFLDFQDLQQFVNR